LPQVPPPQAPAEQLPPAEHALPEATQVGLPAAFWSQHPPLPQVFPSQQTWPGPPQAAHSLVSGSQASPAAVQKSPERPPPPGQHAWPRPPQSFAPAPSQ
jgi:hypothetical protein